MLVVVIVSACAAESPEPDGSAGSAETTTTLATTTTTAPPSTAQTVPAATESVEPDVPDQLEAFATAFIQLDGDELLVAVADTVELRRQGLMLVEDLRDLDGMLFVFPDPTNGGFWMKDTLIPLDIAFFDADGHFVDGFAMEPCTTADCPSYRPDGSYLYALEMPEGQMPSGDIVLDF